MRCAHHSLAAAAAAAVALLSAAGARADPAPFDLAGPTIDVQVTRGASTLPIARVPNLAPGDRVWMKAALTAGQSARYLMVAAFLRGSIDPPPTEWFFRCETWSGKCAKEGMTLTVPPDARQLLVFLAPETGGDFKTLVNAVRGRPGVFVRTSQDLSQAALEHVRLEAYLAAIRGLGDADPARLKEAAPLLSRSLAIKVDEKCLEKVLEVQASCLMQGRESLIMTDGHSASMAQELTSGPASDLAMQASSAPQLKSGLYGPFVGSLLDIARLLDSFRTAQYQYIPALGAAEGRELRLTLNAAPSFHDPKSVLVVALPAVQAPQPPPLRAVDPKETYCARKDPLILPVEGAPLVFATSYAHGMRLTVATKGGAPLELPAKADPVQGGFAIDTSNLRAATLEDGARASLQGEWGFDKYQGPSFQLTDARDQSWELVTGDEAALIAGREDAIRLRAGSARCVAEVALHDANGKDLKVEWKVAKPDELDLKLSLQEASPGNLTLLIREHGHSESHPLVLRTYAEAAHLESFALHAGDRQGVLRGTRLDEVDKLTLEGVEFAPGTLSSSLGRDELVMLAAPPAPDSGDFRSAEATAAHVALKDGRTVEVKASVEAPRPSAILVGKSAQFAAARDEANIRLSSPDELPQNARLTFSLRAQTPAVFAHDEKIEVATADGAWSTLLDTANGALTLQNARVAVATLDPAKALGAAAFGPLQFRRVANGVAGDWKSLATLVRLPTLTNLRCPAAFGTGCTLSGANLFLLDSVSGDAQFAAPTAVPEGFTGESLGVPQPAGNQLYLKLRDDPSVVSIATVAVQGPSPSGESRGPEHSP